MWTADALSSEARGYRGSVWRIVEAQHRVSTMRLTDTLAEQATLERLLDESKPAIPDSCRHLNFLLFTPFRYAPYPHGSRFRRALQREGCFYAAEHIETAIAESAFYRLLFMLESPDMLLPLRPLEHTAFAVTCASERMIDLMEAPLAADFARWTDPVAYGPCQDLADAARGIAIDLIRYRSVRDARGRANVAILSPAAFAETAPHRTETWLIFPRRDAVQVWREFPSNAKFEFQHRDFAGDPRVAAYLANPRSEPVTPVRRRPRR